MSVTVKEIPTWTISMGPALPTYLFLFPDDLNEQTLSIGSTIRDGSMYHNAMGIPLRHFPHDTSLSLFDDEDFEEITDQLTQRFREINETIWKPTSLYQYVAVSEDRKLEGLDVMKAYAPRIHAFLSREWTALLDAVDAGQPSDEYRESPSFPPIEIRSPSGEEEEKEKEGDIGEYKDGVFYFRNFKGKDKERKMLDASRRIHSTDLDEVLKRHVLEWGSRPRATFKDTKDLLNKQYEEIAETPIFRGSALDNRIVGWIGSITAPILLIRKFPSYYAIRDPSRPSGHHREGNGYISVGGMGEHERAGQKRPHEDDLMTELYLRGLPQKVAVCVAFVVPYRPAHAEWEFQPPPAEVTKFTPYLKFLMTSMRNLKYIVVMDRWCAQFVINAKLNYNAMKYTDSTDPPEYGVSTEHPINFYPTPRNRTLKASAYAVFLPHPIQYTSSTKDEHTKRRNKAAFEAGVKAINQVVKPSGSAVDGFSILMGPSKRKRQDVLEGEEGEEEGEEEGGEEGGEGEEGEEILPVIYDDSFWVVRPFRTRTQCACLSCGGCGWKKPLVRGGGVEDDGPDDLGSLERQAGRIALCEYCFCHKHSVHRDLDWNECPSGCIDLVPKGE